MVKSTSSPLSTTKLWSLVLLAFVLALVFLVVKQAPLRTYSIFNRTWGFDQLKFFPVYIQWLGLLFIFLMIIPFVNNWVGSKIFFFVDFISRGLTKQILFVLISGVSALVFYLFSVKYYFLGDFNLRMIQVMNQDFVKEEYLTMFGLFQLTQFFSRFGIGEEIVFKMFSVCMGFLYVLIACGLADILGKNKRQKALYLLSLVCSSQMLLFCGYVEIYSAPSVLLLLYLYAAIKYLKTNSSIIYPIIALLTAIAAHLINAAALPSLALLFWYKHPQWFAWLRQVKFSRRILVIVLLAVFGTFIFYVKGHPFLIPFSAAIPGRMTLLSLPHVWEYFNGILLCSGPAILFIIIILVFSLKQNENLSSEFYFSITVAAAVLWLIFVSDLQRGSGDWDIMSFSTAPLLLAAITGLSSLSNNQKHNDYLLLFLISFNLLNAALWLQINHGNRSIRKIESMLDGDPGSYYSARIGGKVQLALCYKNNHLFVEAETIARKACNESPKEEVRACLMVAERLIDNKKFEEAQYYLENILNERTDAVYEPYLFLLPYYNQTNQSAKLLLYLNKMFDAFVKNPKAFMGSQNFKKEVVIGLFQGLYETEKPISKDTLRLAQMKNLVDELGKWHPPIK